VWPDFLERLHKHINESTLNVQVLLQRMTAENGGQCIELGISRVLGVASTTDGCYFLRVSDACQPVIGDVSAVGSGATRSTNRYRCVNL
jgi:ATP-dependent DNA helicase RecG